MDLSPVLMLPNGGIDAKAAVDVRGVGGGLGVFFFFLCWGVGGGGVWAVLGVLGGFGGLWGGGLGVLGRGGLWGFRVWGFWGVLKEPRRTFSQARKV